MLMRGGNIFASHGWTVESVNRKWHYEHDRLFDRIVTYEGIEGTLFRDSELDGCETMVDNCLKKLGEECRAQINHPWIFLHPIPLEDSRQNCTTLCGLSLPGFVWVDFRLVVLALGN